MAVDPKGRPNAGRDDHAEIACASSPPTDALLTGPCSCLPQAVDDWPACASCGLRQKPGKAFCSFCGRRWVTEDAETTASSSA